MAVPIPPLPGKGIPVPKVPKAMPVPGPTAGTSMRSAMSGSAKRVTASATDVAAKAVQNPASEPDAEPQKLTTGEKAKSAAKQAAKDVAGETLRGAGQGLVTGGAHGAAVGALKGVGYGLAKNRTVLTLVASILTIIVGFQIAIGAGVAGVLTTAAEQISFSDERTSVQSAVNAGEDEESIKNAQSIANGGIIPWQVIAAIKSETYIEPDLKKIEAALYEVDPNSRYRSLATGASYSSSSHIRSIGTTSSAMADAKKVEDVWVAALSSALEIDVPVAEAVYRQALTWYLGQSFNNCGRDIELAAEGGQSTQLDASQIAIAKTIIGVSKSAFSNVEDQRAAAVILISAAMEESAMKNITDDEKNTRGVFQRESVTPWGTDAQNLDVAYATTALVKQFTEVPEWRSTAITDLLDLAFKNEDPGMYSRWEVLSRTTVIELFDPAPPVPLPDAGYIPDETPSDLPGGVILCIGGNLIVNGGTSLPVVNYTLFSGFGPRTSPGGVGSTDHKGQDMSTPGCTNNPPHREPIYSVQAGTVEKAVVSSANRGYGTWVQVNHGNGFVTRYAHMLVDSLQVSAGDPVVAGQMLGHMGTTGSSTGCHLHFETVIDGAQQNPVIVMLRLGVKL